LKKASKAHQETIGRIIRKHSSSPQAAIIKGDKSLYDEARSYWSTRNGKHPKMPNRKAKLNNRVKYPWYGLHLLEWDVLEIAHQTSRAIGGKNEWKIYNCYICIATTKRLLAITVKKSVVTKEAH